MIEECQAIAEAVARIGRRYHPLKGKGRPRARRSRTYYPEEAAGSLDAAACVCGERQEHRGKRA
jgi:hypothetical protein